MDRRLYDSPDAEEPLRLYVEDEGAGRRVPVELRISGRAVEAVVVDLPEFEEPPVPEPPEGAASDPRRSPIDPDDFESRPVAAAG